MYYSILFDRAPTGFGTFKAGTVSAGSTTTSGTQTGAYVTFDTTGNSVVNATVGISFVSVANAAEQRRPPRPATFATVRAGADAAWNTALNRVQVTGGATTICRSSTPRSTTCCQNPNLASDTNGAVPRLRQRRAHREPPDLPELLGLGHLPLLGVAGRADRPGRDDATS